VSPERQISRVPTRAVFAELLAGALDRTRVWPSPLATAYLVELLEERVAWGPVPGAGETLAEALLAARRESGAARIRHLRGLGDRALFVSGFFGDSLARRPVGIRYYGDAGRLAYAGVSAALGAPQSQLFEELADRFVEFAEVLAEVGDSTRARGARGLVPLYERYLRTGSARDRRRLLRRGLSVPESERGRFDQ